MDQENVDLYTMEFYSATKRIKFCHLQVNGFNCRTSSEVKLARLRRPKIVCSPSYVDYSPKRNALLRFLFNKIGEQEARTGSARKQGHGLGKGRKGEGG
jgi:hypothetical protein